MCGCTRRAFVFAALGAATATRAGAATRNDFVAAAFRMREQAVAAGDQAYGAVVVRTDEIVGWGPSRVRERGAWACKADPQAGGKRLVDRGSFSNGGQNRPRAESRERSRGLPTPGAVVVAVFQVAAEAQAMATLCPVDVVGELKGPRMTILRNVDVSADLHSAK